MRTPITRWLAFIAGVLALAALLAGDRRSALDSLSPVHLATWIREQRRGLRVLDLRSRADFETYHIPGAEHVPADSLYLVSFGAGQTFVLYSDGALPNTLPRSPTARVYVLRGGLTGWLTDVINPRLARPTTPEQESQVRSRRELTE